MTAAGSPVSSPFSSHSSPACLPACRLRKGDAARTRLHLRSAPGAWLMVGVVVVLAGMSVAAAGYVSAAPRPAGGRGTGHVDRMKLAGPVVMGVGLFIFICAATLLYENRDREGHRLETCEDLEDLKGDLGWEDSQEEASFSSRERWEITDGVTPPLSKQDWTLYPPSLSLSEARQNLQDVKGSPLPHLDHAEDGGAAREGKSTLLAQVVHHEEPSPHSSSPGPSLPHSSAFPDDCGEIDFRPRTP
ncbi:transmembrane protein 200C [Syngnathoides biaculeatus]|uniref:transmembrane protein 200C n=1 Tax=Syngnathoides biaculeatus TaxID=300417 RepID=UPI002ADDE344|nr:transmembrane protein 200C [Syngnathoides biaculeatus]